MDGVTRRGTDTRDADQIQSEKNQSITFSYVTKNFPSCTAVKELKMEILPNQIFTLLGPVPPPVRVKPRTAAARPRRSAC